MTLQDTLEELDETLSAVHRVLGEEYAALSVLDGAGIESAAARKAELNVRLEALVGRVALTPKLRQGILRLRAAAQTNQALLIHARACVRGALDLASGSPLDGVGYAKRGSNSCEAPLCLNTRG